MRAIDLCDHPSGCDSEGTEHIELAGHWHDLLRCVAHAERVERCDRCEDEGAAQRRFDATLADAAPGEPYHVRRARSRQ